MVLFEKRWWHFCNFCRLRSPWGGLAFCLTPFGIDTPGLVTYLACRSLLTRRARSASPGGRNGPLPTETSSQTIFLYNVATEIQSSCPGRFLDSETLLVA